jgi:ankyrin repeat protein
MCAYLRALWLAPTRGLEELFAIAICVIVGIATFALVFGLQLNGAKMIKVVGLSLIPIALYSVIVFVNHLSQEKAKNKYRDSFHLFYCVADIDDRKYLQTFVIFRYKSDNKTDLKALKSLIKAGADTEVRNNIGDTPLSKAARYKSFNAALVLIDNGANINTKNNEGDTPLLLAAYDDMCDSIKKNRKRRDIKLLKMLVEHGADNTAIGSKGKTAYDFLLNRGFEAKEIEFLKPFTKK